MLKEDRARIIHGEVFYRNQWMPAAKKAAMEKKRRIKIEQGLVSYQGEWITIEEKLARTSSSPAQQPPPQQVIINQTFNQQTYDQRTIDQRTTHEHKHVHLDADTLMAYGKAKGLGGPPSGAIDGKIPPALGGKRGKKGKALADKTDKQYLADKSQTHYLEDRSNEQIVDYVEEVDIEDITPDKVPPADKEVNLEDIPKRNKNKPITPSPNPAENIIDLEDISDADVEEFLG